MFVPLGALYGEPMHTLSLMGGVSPRGPHRDRHLRALLLRGTSALHLRFAVDVPALCLDDVLPFQHADLLISHTNGQELMAEQIS